MISPASEVFYAYILRSVHLVFFLFCSFFYFGLLLFSFCSNFHYTIKVLIVTANYMDAYFVLYIYVLLRLVFVCICLFLSGI
jgi:hypothetical protein